MIVKFNPTMHEHIQHIKIGEVKDHYLGYIDKMS